MEARSEYLNEAMKSTWRLTGFRNYVLFVTATIPGRVTPLLVSLVGLVWVTPVVRMVISSAVSRHLVP